MFAGHPKPSRGRAAAHWTRDLRLLLVSSGLFLSGSAWASAPSAPAPASQADQTKAETAADSEEKSKLEARVKSLEEMVELMGALETPPASAASAPSQARPPAKNLDIAVILDTALAWFSEEGLQTGAHDPTDTGFHLQQVEMALGQNVDHLFELRAYLVFTQFGVELEEAYGRSLALPGGFQFRAGQFLTRMGRLNATHPHAWSFIDQAMVNGTFLGSEGSRGAGLEVSWLAPLPWYVNRT